MEEPLEHEHSMTNDDLKPSSSSTTTKSSSRSVKQTTNGTTRRHKRRRRRQTNSTRSSSEHSTSSSRSSSASSISNHSSQSSMKTHQTNETETKKTRSCLAQEQLQTIIDKTKTGKYEILDSFSFLTFENEDDWKIAFEHFKQQQLQQSYTTKKSYSLMGKKNGSIQDHHIDVHTLNRSISMPCKIEESNRVNHLSSVSIDESPVWQNHSPNKSERQSLTTIKTEPKDRSHRTTSEHDENHFDNREHSTTSSQKSSDDMKSDSNERKHHHHHHHYHHKSHKRHKTNHDLSVNGDGSTKHPTITSMSDLAKQQIKHESMSIPPPFNFPPQFDSKLFSLPSYSPFAVPHPPPPLPPSHAFPGSFDPSLMLASRLYGSQYPRDLPMPPPPIPSARPPSRSLQNPFSLKENHSMEKMFEKFYPGVLPGYLAAAASAAAAASTNSSNSPVSSMNIKMHGASPNGPDHPLWSHRDALQRQFSSPSTKSTSMKSPLFDSTSKLSSNHPTSSPTDHHHHHHHRRHSSSTSNPDLPNPTTPTGPPLYLAPVIVTEFHQHQHNHNHTHEHKLNITTKDDRSSSPLSSRSKTPLSNESKKPKTSFSVTDMFNDKTSPIIKHSPSSQSQGFLSVVSNKKDTNSSSSSSSLTPSFPLKKPSNVKWSTAHIHIAWMIYHHEQRQRDKLNPLNPTNKIRPSPTHTHPSQSSSTSNQSTFLPPPLPVIDNNDLSLLRPHIPPSPLFSSFPFDISAPQNHLFRPASTTKLPRPTVTPTVKREQKTPLFDERMRHTSPSPLSRSTSGSNFLPSSPSQRMKMEYPSLVLPPPTQHHMPSFSLNDDRKRFMQANTDFLPPFGPNSVASSPLLSSLFPMSASSIPLPPPIPSPSSSRRSGINNDLSKSSLFPPPPSSTPFDFTRSPLMPPPPLGAPGLSLPTNHLESDRYRFLLEQQARERDLQFALMAAASGSGPPPPSPFFTDPNFPALFKHF